MSGTGRPGEPRGSVGVRSSVPGSDGAHVVVSGGAVEWGLPAAEVTRIVADSDWNGPPPLDVAGALGLAPSQAAAGSPRRILVVATGGGEVAIQAAGRISTRSIDPSAVWPLPALVRTTTPGRLLASIVLAPGETPLLVLDATELAAWLRARVGPLAGRVTGGGSPQEE